MTIPANTLGIVAFLLELQTKVKAGETYDFQNYRLAQSFPSGTGSAYFPMLDLAPSPVTYTPSQTPVSGEWLFPQRGAGDFWGFLMEFQAAVQAGFEISPSTDWFNGFTGPTLLIGSGFNVIMTATAGTLAAPMAMTMSIEPEPEPESTNSVTVPEVPESITEKADLKEWAKVNYNIDLDGRKTFENMLIEFEQEYLEAYNTEI